VTWTPSRAALVAAIGVIGIEAAVVWPFTVDDAYITFRYARNLADGFGAVFNPHQAPAEGYTSVLWLLVITAVHRLRLDAVLVAKVIGLIATAAWVCVLRAWSLRLSRDNGSSPEWPAAVAVLLGTVSGAAAVHAVSGMETPAAVLLFTLFLYATYRLVGAPTDAGAFGTGGLAALSCLTRPELTVACGAALIAVVALVAPPTRGRVAVRAFAAWVLPLAVSQAIRLGYYDAWFPLPFYVKVANAPLFAGAAAAGLFARFIALRLGLLIVPGLARVRRPLVPSLAAAAALLLALLHTAPIMNFEWRYFFPLVPLIMLVAADGYAALQPLWEARGGLRSRVMRGAIVGLVVVVGAAGTPRRLEAAREYAAGMAAAHERLGRRLARLPVHGSIAIDDAGAVPYLSGWAAIDTFGLNDPAIARTGTHDATRVLARRPDVLVLISAGRDRFQPGFAREAALYADATRAGYRMAATLRFGETYYLWVMNDPRSEAGRAVADASRLASTAP
jgi:hypothetical protein